MSTIIDGDLQEWEQQIDEWRGGLNIQDLEINKAWFTIKSLVEEDIVYNWQTGICHGVSYKRTL